jgi:hypothetical protein
LEIVERKSFLNTNEVLQITWAAWVVRNHSLFDEVHHKLLFLVSLFELRIQNVDWVVQVWRVQDVLFLEQLCHICKKFFHFVQLMVVEVLVQDRWNWFVFMKKWLVKIVWGFFRSFMKVIWNDKNGVHGVLVHFKLRNNLASSESFLNKPLLFITLKGIKEIQRMYFSESFLNKPLLFITLKTCYSEFFELWAFIFEQSLQFLQKWPHLILQSNNCWQFQELLSIK